MEYGIASRSRADVEPLGKVSRRVAEETLADSRRQWPDLYLVQRAGRGRWQPAS